jgi:ABC-type nitrate/sulfonate/bicarbonate transport system substrate-binding protein
MGESFGNMKGMEKMKSVRKNRKLSRKRIVVALLIAMLMVMAFTACGGGGGTESKSSEGAGTKSSASESDGNIVIKLSAFGKFGTYLNAPIVADALGYFNEEGITVEDAGDIPPIDQLPALLSDTVDIGQFMMNDGVKAVANGADIVAIAADQFTTEVRPHTSFVALKDGGVSKGQDLIGTSVGAEVAVGECMTTFLLHWMQDDGVENPKEQVEFVTQVEETLVDSLRAGDYAAVALHEPPEVIEKLYPDLVVLTTDYEEYGSLLGDVGWFAKRSYIEENPEAVTGFVKAIAKTNDYILEHPEEAASLYLENTRYKINEEIFHVQGFSEHALIRKENVEAWIDVLGDGSLIPPGIDSSSVKGLDPETVYTNEFNPYA